MKKKKGASGKCPRPSGPVSVQPLRIMGGGARGIVLKTPGASAVRPATGYLREAVFSSLGARVAGARVLDCFAGSGAYGLEAWSRGAGEVVFLERDRALLGCLAHNVAAVAKSMNTSSQERPRVISGDFWRTPPPPGGFDLVFADPPYDLLEAHAGELLEGLRGWLAEGPRALIILEGPGSLALPAPWPQALVKCLRKGPRQPAAFMLQPAAGETSATAR